MHPLAIALVVSTLATLLSRFAPAPLASSLVGLTFLGAAYGLCVRGGHAGHFGLAFGGLAEDVTLDGRRLVRDTLGALGWAIGAALVVLPPFWVAFVVWYSPDVTYSAARAWHELPILDLVLGHLLVVALPEEAFFRGYLQTSLDDRWGTPWRVLGAPLGLGLLVTSATFALGHLAALPYPARLAVFFPSLLFGYLRTRSGGIGAPLVLHALCNLFAAWLAAAYGFETTH